MTASERLRALVAEATPGPWRTAAYYDGPALTVGDANDTFLFGYDGEYANPADARLIALAPQLAELVADMGEALHLLRTDIGFAWAEKNLPRVPTWQMNDARARDLLARLEVL